MAEAKENNKKNEEVFDYGLFQNPTAQYRGAPFWAWNSYMSTQQIDRTLECLKEMGMGGAHFHCRTGMEIPYLSREFMDTIRYAHEKASELNMLTWLYDEDRWPSGFAGGLVTREEAYKSRFLVFSPKELSEKEMEKETAEASAKAVLSGKRKFLMGYGIKLKDGYLEDYLVFQEEDGHCPQGYEKWYAYLEIAGNTPWFNNQSYVDTLNPRAMRRFLEVTHEAYFRELGEDFGKTIPAIFTDEPQFSFKTTLGYAAERTVQTIPYTDDFQETYQKAYGEGILEHLPELFWELPEGEISEHRYRYHDHVCRRFTEAFADQIGQWCKEHNICLTGHMMQEPSLQSQTAALGEAMRSYRAFDIPGIDMLCDRRELTTAKQCQSAAHQYGRNRVMSEIYGVTNWDFDFRGHKLAGDWQAALGVTNRVHHLTWTCMAGEAKRDYPASIGYQSPWYKEYSYIENYFSRLNTVLTRGKPIVRIGVIHPIESYWLFWGTREHTADIRKDMDEDFVNLVKWLLYGLLDFDFISEALLEEFEEHPYHPGETPRFSVGEMNYDVILVPNCVTLRENTRKRLEKFSQAGGRILFSGRIPEYVDAKKSPRVKELADKPENRCRFARNEILGRLESFRMLDIRNETGGRVENMLYQMRQDGNVRWLFLAHAEKPENPHICQKEELTITVRGSWEVVKFDLATGEHFSCESICANGNTVIKEDAYVYDSFLYQLLPERKESRGKEGICFKTAAGEAKKRYLTYSHRVPFALSEPNVLILDMAEYRFDQGEWMPEEEILRIDNLFRKKLGYPLRAESYAQPWTEGQPEEICHSLSLRYTIVSDCAVEAPMLAAERLDEIKVILNGEPVAGSKKGWYTDCAIQTLALPGLQKGVNILEIQMPFYKRFDVEAAYLLGDFGVGLGGRCARLTERAKEIAFGDICPQGLPFYGGNISYEVIIQVPEDAKGHLMVEVSQFAAPVIKAYLDGAKKGHIAIAPYRLDLGEAVPGRHTVTLEAFGSRVNTFGPLHNANRTEQWIGPNAWRTEGAAWSYEYQLKQTGILVSPVVWIEKSE